MPQPATPRDGKVTRELVLATVLEIIDHDGADALSMRRLAAALERDPMVLYRHAPGKAQAAPPTSPRTTRPATWPMAASSGDKRKPSRGEDHADVRR